MTSTRSDAAGARSLRVAFVIADLGSGGAERQVALMGGALAARGVDVHLATYGEDQYNARLLPPQVARQHVRIERGRLRFGVVFGLRRWLRTIDPDVVVSFLPGATRWVALAAPRRRRWRWVVSERSQQSQEPVRGYYAAARRADAMVANAHATVDELRSFGFPDVRYVPNGVPAPPPLSPRAYDGPARLLAVGSIQAYKNHPLMLRALAELTDLPWTFAHVGRPLQAQVAEEMRSILAENPALAGRVTLHGQQEDVGRFYESSDLLLIASRYEGFPNVLLEAWSHGCAALVSDRSDLPRQVRHGVTGWVFPLDDPRGLVRALRERLEAGVAPMRAAGAAGYEEVRTRYRVEAVAQQWHEVLSDIAGRR